MLVSLVDVGVVVDCVEDLTLNCGVCCVAVGWLSSGSSCRVDRGQ